ncbi:MAG: CopD family protein, partial [Chthoniobacteraceae bacterium]
MEHAALHGVILVGLILALGGPLAAALLRSSDAPLALFTRIARVTALGALAAALATFLDFGVQVAEVQGQTIFAGSDFSTLMRFATATTVGRLDLARAALLALTGVLALRSLKFASVTAFAAVIFTSFVSHAAALPEQRAAAIGAQILHITAVAIWMGVLLQFYLLGEGIHGNATLVAVVVRRFTPIALTATATLLLTGVVATLRGLREPIAFFGSAYGWTLLVKLALIGPAVFAGWMNFRHARTAPQRFARMLELEVLAGVLVVVVAGVLGSVSPPGADDSLCLTRPQVHALLSPDLPTSHVDDWAAPENPRGPTEDDLRYSELTHNSSGVIVCLLGICWLVQARGGRLGWLAARLAPFLLLPFGAFIAVAANPELWLLRTVPAWEALRNPQLLEHQLGALLVFALAWLAWRDRRRPAHLQPLGYPLPLIMIAGSLLLLGHAHSTLSIPDELTNLINVQHAIMGACGLFGGTLRLM